VPLNLECYEKIMWNSIFFFSFSIFFYVVKIWVYVKSQSLKHMKKQGDEEKFLVEALVLFLFLLKDRFVEALVFL